MFTYENKLRGTGVRSQQNLLQTPQPMLGVIGNQYNAPLGLNWGYNQMYQMQGNYIDDNLYNSLRLNTYSPQVGNISSKYNTPIQQVPSKGGLFGNWNNMSAGDKLGGIANVAGGAMGMVSNFIDNTKSGDVETMDMQANTKGDLMSRGNAFASTHGYDNQLGRTSVGGATASGVGQGAMIGTQILPGWGTLIGGVVGGIGGAVTSIFGNDKKADKEKAAREKTIREFSARNQYINQRDIGNWQGQQLAYGGILPQTDMVNRALALKGNNLFAYGGDFTNGVTSFNVGNTHENNSLGGIPVGIGDNGEPNLVEEGEVKWNNYIFSDRFKITNPDEYQLPLALKNKTFADAALSLSKESEERPNDPISKLGLNVGLSKLMIAQEMKREDKLNGGNVFAYGGQTDDNTLQNVLSNFTRVLSMRHTTKKDNFEAARNTALKLGNKTFMYRGKRYNTQDEVTEERNKYNTQSETTKPTSYAITPSWGNYLNFVPNSVTGGVRPISKPTSIPETSESNPDIDVNLLTEADSSGLMQAYIDNGITNPELLRLLYSQDMLETGFGKFVHDNNWGNITRGSAKEGTFKTRGDKDAKGNKITQEFRTYSNVDDYVKDKIAVLKRTYGIDNSTSLDDAVTKLTGGKEGKGAKWAEDPNYASKLRSVIAGDSTVKGNSIIEGDSIAGSSGVSTIPEISGADATGSAVPVISERAGKAFQTYGDTSLRDNISNNPLLAMMEKDFEYRKGRDIAADQRDKDLQDQLLKEAKKLNTLRYAPLFTNATMLGQLMSETPDSLRLGRIAPQPVNERLSYDPIDSEYIANQVRQQGAATARGLMDVAGGNRAVAQAGLLAANRSTGNAIGEALFRSKEANDLERERVMGFNRSTSQFNAQQDLRGQEFNVNAFNQEQMWRKQAEAAQRNMLREGWAGIGNTLGAIGTENRYFRMAPILSGGYNSMGILGANKEKFAQGGFMKFYKKRIK